MAVLLSLYKTRGLLYTSGMLSGEIIALKDVTLSSPTDTLLESVSFSFSEKSRIAIVGSNGSGKSTLLKAMAGLLEPESGTIINMKGAVIEYIPQFVPLELRSRQVLSVIQEHIEQRRPTVADWKPYAMLSDFGFNDKIYTRKLGELSGGEANRVMLARALLVEPDFVLLDEPTNHLDIQATLHFEKLINETQSIPFCLVSHDRQLLDSCTEHTLFLRDKSFYFFGHPYSMAKDALIAHDEKVKQQAADEQKEIARLKTSADKMQNWVKMNSKFASRYQNMRRRVEDLKNNQTQVSIEKRKELTLSDAQLRAKRVIEIPEFAVGRPGSPPLFAINKFSVGTGDRIAVIGPNGAGKSTFLQALIASFAEPVGEIKFNPQVKLGYFDQELAILPEDITPLEYLSRTLESCADEKIIKALIAAGIPYHRHNDLLPKFSGGERARIVFVQLKLSTSNCLVLDEPTNHIDVQGIEDLEYQLLTSGNTVITVSHDRRFVETVADRFFVIKDGELAEVADLEAYYSSVLLEDSQTAAEKPPQKPGKARSKDSPESIMEKLIALETELSTKKLTQKERELREKQVVALNEKFESLCK